MANRFPLIVDSSALQVKELPASDNLDLANSSIVNVVDINATGVTTSATIKVGTGIALDATTIKVGTGITLDATSGIITAVNGFVGNLTGNVTGNATGLSGSPSFNALDITCNSIINNAGGGATWSLFNTGNATFSGNVSVGGVLTYEDVTNVDSIGIVTARGGFEIGAAGVGGTITAVGNAQFVGIASATAFAGYDYLRAPFSSTVSFAVTVAAKTAAHRYNGTGSSNAFLIDGVQSPFLTLTPGRTYRFVHDNTGSHPLKFYLEADKTTLYSTGVTFDNAYTEIAVTDSTPQVLHYQCTNHAYMGNAVSTNSNAVVSTSAAIFKSGLVEKYENAGTTLGAQTANPLSDGNVILFTGNESGNTTINFTGVHATLSNGETVSFTAILTPNNSGVINVVQVDGQAITVKWSGGSAPTAGASGQDIYTFQILKTGTGTSDYTVFGAAANYA